MAPETFLIKFRSYEDNVKGKAEIVVLQEDKEIIYLARNIRFDNTNEELLEAQIVVEPELRIKALMDKQTDYIHWIEADSEEESEMATLIGAAIEEHQM